jgi:hypothetical protein
MARGAVNDDAVRNCPALDGLRCLAIMGVVWHHSLPCAYPGWLGRGHVGVPLFFALSGFLITRLLLAERQSTGDIALGRFWMRRSLRIAPLYYATLAGFVVYLALLEPNDATRHFWSSLPFYASYTSNWFVDFDVAHPVWFGFGWSLATEEQFYLWWPIFLRYAERLHRVVSALGLLALIALDQLAESGAFAPWIVSGSTAARIATSASGAMALGALLGWALSQPRAFAPLKRALAARHAHGLVRDGVRSADLATDRTADRARARIRSARRICRLRLQQFVRARPRAASARVRRPRELWRVPVPRSGARVARALLSVAGHATRGAVSAGVHAQPGAGRRVFSNHRGAAPGAQGALPTLTAHGAHGGGCAERRDGLGARGRMSELAPSSGLTMP